MTDVKLLDSFSTSNAQDIIRLIDGRMFYRSREDAMKLLVLSLALFAGQTQISRTQDVVRLPAHLSAIRVDDGGKMVELLYAAPVISLPKKPPQVSVQGAPWYVDVKNLGPADVALEGEHGFTVNLPPKETVRIRTTGDRYSVSRP